LYFFTDLFLRNEIDMAMFTTLKDEDLFSIGVTSFGARKILLNAIQGELYYIFPKWIKINLQVLFDLF
jgi:hypothetical protein